MKNSEQNKLLKIVKDNYREIAGQFDVTRKKHVWPELELLAEKIHDGYSVLDVGCGNGRLLEVLGNKKINYLGTDNSEELIALAKKNYPSYNFKVVDILELDKALNEKFDLVISVAVLHHLPGQALQAQALQQLKKVAKNQIIFSVWKMWGNKKYQKFLFKNIWEKIMGRSQLEFGDILFPWKNSRGEVVSERYYHAFTKVELKKLLKKAGFKKFEIRSDKHNYWVNIDTL